MLFSKAIQNHSKDYHLKLLFQISAKVYISGYEKTIYPPHLTIQNFKSVVTAVETLRHFQNIRLENITNLEFIGKESIFNDTVNLRTFEIYNTNIPDFTGSLFKEMIYKNIYFENVEIGIIDGHVFDHIQVLKNLEFRNVRINKIVSAAFRNITVVENIKFSNSKIDLLGTNSFIDIEIYQNLELHNVTFKTISPEAFKKIKINKTLDLDQLNIIDISSKAFCEISANNFKLSNSNIESFHHAFHHVQIYNNTLLDNLNIKELSNRGEYFSKIFKKSRSKRV